MKNDPRIIVLTGCTRGLGRVLATRFTKMGHRVHGCGRSTQDIASLAQELGDKATLSAVDVADARAVADWAARTLAEAGPPDLLINNAAVINENTPLWKISPEEFSRIVDINLKGIHHVLHAFLPAMLPREKGILINISSGYGRIGASGVAPYCCTKFGVEGLTQSLAEELPGDMAAIPLSPGIINTAMLRTTFGANATHYETPETWVERAAPYILSLGREHNGQSLRIPN